MAEWVVPILIDEPTGLDRVAEPVTVGIPFPKGVVHADKEIGLFAESCRLPLQAEVTRRWRDGSIQWILVDFQVTLAAGQSLTLRLRGCPEDAVEPRIEGAAETAPSRGRVEVRNGSARFLFGGSSLLEWLTEEDGQSPNRLVTALEAALTDTEGRVHGTRWNRWEKLTEGPLRSSIRLTGEVESGVAGKTLDVECLCSIFAGRNQLRVDCTIRNPEAAKHQGGRWDLGDEGSVLFRDFSIRASFEEGRFDSAWFRVDADAEWRRAETGSVKIQQMSSGGENWRGINHRNRFGHVPHSVPGYRVVDGDEESEGRRATPVLECRLEDRSVWGAIVDFWQNFPTSIATSAGEMVFGLYPSSSGGEFELQGGEQKTHRLYLEISSSHDSSRLQWIDEPLVPRASPQTYQESGVFYDFSIAGRDRDPRLREIVTAAIEGESTFEDGIEKIDEFGWRNFGDLYADHEEAFYKGTEPLVSHYNNQYDLIQGFQRQFLKTGDRRWRRLMERLARHVMDIDIYHTKLDKSAYNGGLFWHTAHYLHAGRATHRTYSRYADPGHRMDESFGGGPANEHNYSSGLLYYYYLTGEPMAKESVLSLAHWVCDMEDGSKTVLRYLDSGDTGLSSKTRGLDFHGPGRGAGNSINCLIDAYILADERRYLEQAESLIRRCIHPDDPLASMQLDEPEERWSYAVFLQVLGRYLKLKLEIRERDWMYGYAKASLTHYATWMLEHEQPYLDEPDLLEYPTETWAAQDMRKSCVLVLGARFGPASLRDAFLKRAKHFYDRSLDQLAEFDTRHGVRPIAILLACGDLMPLFEARSLESAPESEETHDFGVPKVFLPQRARAKAKLLWLGIGLVCLSALLLATWILVL